MNNAITWQYAVNFNKQEERWNELKENLQSIVRVFAKNTILQLTHMEINLQTIDMIAFINDGDRSEFLYQKAKELVDDTATLEKVGSLLTKTIIELRNQNLD